METWTSRLLRVPFPVLALLFGFLLAAVENAPAFIGWAPLPAEIILNFPPWNSIRGGWPIVLPHGEMGDSVTQFYVWRTFAASAWQEGIFPAWNPHLLLGTPFLANSTSALFYPPHFLYLVLPPHAGWALAAILRTMLAVLFAALLAKELGASRAGALVAGLVYSHCGFMVAWGVWPQSDAALWLPLMLYGVHRLRFRPSRSAVAVTGFAFAMPVLAGHPEIAVYVTLAGVAFWAFCLLLPGVEGAVSRPRYTLLFTAAGLLALGLAAVQMLPTLEWVGEINRSTEAVWPHHRPLAEVVAFVSRHARAPVNPVGVAVPEGTAYAGIFTLLAAPLAFLPSRRGRAVPAFFALLLAIAAQVVYGLGPVFRLALAIPVLKSFPSNRVLVLMDLSLAVLAALGITALQEKPRAAAGLLLTAVPATILLVLATSVGGRAAFGNPFGLLSSWLFLAAGAVLLVLAASRLRPRTFGLCALALLSADLMSFALWHVPFFPARQIFPEPRVFRFLRDLPGGTGADPFRIATLDFVAPPNAEMAYGLSSPVGYDFLLARTMRVAGPFTDAGRQRGILSCMVSGKVAATEDRRLDLMNVRFLVSTRANSGTANMESRPDRFRQVYDDGAAQVFENLRVLPRALLVPLRAARTLPDESALARLEAPDFDPTAEVLLADALPAVSGMSGSAEPAAGPSRVLGIETGIGRTRVTASVAEPSILVVSETHYPGWTVRVDGRREPLLRADYTFQGVLLRPGKHDVEFTFESPVVRAGLALSGVSLLAFLALCVPWAGLRRYA